MAVHWLTPVSVIIAALLATHREKGRLTAASQYQTSNTFRPLEVNVKTGFQQYQFRKCVPLA